MWKHGNNIETVITPKDFVITPQDVHYIIRYKNKYRIYTDSDSYYLLELTSFRKVNSTFVKKNGIRIDGKSIDDYREKHHQLNGGIINGGRVPYPLY